MKRSVVIMCVVATLSALTACSGTEPKQEHSAVSSTKTPLVTWSDAGTTYDCTVFKSANLGTSGQNYDSNHAQKTLYAFVNAAKSRIDSAVATLDNTSGESASLTAQADLAEVVSEMDNLKDTLYVSGADYAFDNDSVNLTYAGLTANFLYWLSAGALQSVLTADTYVNAVSQAGPNDATYAALYARKAAELANQIAYNAEYCNLKDLNYQIPNAADTMTFPNLGVDPGE